MKESKLPPYMRDIIRGEWKYLLGEYIHYLQPLVNDNKDKLLPRGTRMMVTDLLRGIGYSEKYDYHYGAIFVYDFEIGEFISPVSHPRQFYMNIANDRSWKIRCLNQ